MKTAIIILNYNDYETTYNMINQIKNYQSLDLIIVVDNNSNDKSYEKLKKIETKKIKVIKTDINKGYAAGNNYGLNYLDKNYQVDYVIISNPDIEVSNDVIEVLKDDLNNNNNISLIAPKIDEKGIISQGWKLPKFKEDLISNFNYFHKYAKKMLNYNNEYYNKKLVNVEAVSGCFFMIRFKDIKRINFFDENTFLYYEENIIGKKLKDLNLKTYIDNDTLIKHNLSISVNKNINSLKKYKILKTSQIYYEKKYNKLNILGIIILKLTYYLSYFISYLYIKFKRR